MRDSSNNELYNRVIDNIPIIIYSFSTNGGGSYYSPAVEDILGYSVNELLDNPLLWYNSIHKDDLALVDNSISNAAMGIPFDIKYRIKNSSGAWLHFHDQSINIVSKNNVLIRIDGMVQDITLQINAEKKTSSERATV